MLNCEVGKFIISSAWLISVCHLLPSFFVVADKCKSENITSFSGMFLTYFMSVNLVQKPAPDKLSHTKCCSSRISILGKRLTEKTYIVTMRKWWAVFQSQDKNQFLIIQGKCQWYFWLFPLCFHRHLCHMNQMEHVTMHPPNITPNTWNCAAVDANQVGRKSQKRECKHLCCNLQGNITVFVTFWSNSKFCGQLHKLL